jgi:hypothetical protein
MLGRKMGAESRLKKLFAKIIVWYSFKHSLELIVSEVFEQIHRINNFQTLFDKLHSLYPEI